MSMSLNRSRTLFGLGALAALCLMLVALLYFQQHLALAPCPLCILQRIGVIAIGITCLIATIHGPGVWGTRVYSFFIACFAVAGGSVSARHGWLQRLPENQVPECGPGLDYMLDSFPLSKVLELILRGSGECAEVSWSFLGLSIPDWTLVAFAGFFVAAVGMALRARSLALPK